MEQGNPQTLIEKHYKKFEIEDPVSAFRDFINRKYYTERIIDIFFKNNQELISNFIEVIKKYFQQISSSESRNIDVLAYYKITNFLRIIYLKYPTYLSNFDEKLSKKYWIKLLFPVPVTPQANMCWARSEMSRKRLYLDLFLEIIFPNFIVPFLDFNREGLSNSILYFGLILNEFMNILIDNIVHIIEKKK